MCVIIYSMKLSREDIDRLYAETNEAFDVQRDESGRVIAFAFKKYYGAGKRSGRIIRVSVKKTPPTAEYLSEQDFFKYLYAHADEATDIKVSAGKIVRYTIDGKSYKTDKPDVPRLFAQLDYKDFLRICKDRFYHIDDRLRNGYFSGLQGTNNAALAAYKKSKQKYTLYDVDFNSAYPACFRLPLPCGRFYTPEQWKELPEQDKRSFTRFYDMQIKTIPNAFNIFVPPSPFVEYADFDFLLQKTSSRMIVSDVRRELIDAVYGADAYVVRGTWYVKTKIYLKLWNFAQDLYERIQAAKRDGEEELRGRLKIALNSLVGNFGRRDEERTVTGVERVESAIFPDVLQMRWSTTKKEKPNYLPLAMYINDITALRLFKLLTDEHILRICYNTDGGIIALPNGYKIITSKRIGWLKATEIADARFYETSLLYGRPLVLDAQAGRVYNSNCVTWDAMREVFIASEMFELNTGHGFVSYANEYAIPVKAWRTFNLRRSEIIIRLQKNETYLSLKRAGKRPNDDDAAAVFEWELRTATLRQAGEDFDRLCNPYDASINEIRHAPPRKVEYQQLSIFDKTFFVKCRKND